MKILMIAADRMEFSGIVSRAKASRPSTVPVRWAREVEVSGNTLLLAANGMGCKRAAEATDAALGTFPADVVVSTGFCGALSPELGIADIVVGTRVNRGEQSFDARQPRSDRAHSLGPIVSIDRIAQTAQEKKALHDAGAVAVEMEAGGVAERPKAHGIAFYCIRAVSDLAGEDMANDFNAALRGDGHFATIKLLTGTLRKPFVRLPELIRLRNRCARAERVLGDFIADCRF